MKVKLTKGQIELIANEVAGIMCDGKTARTKSERRPRHITFVGVGLPPAAPSPAEVLNPDENLLLTVRADLVAVVQAIRNGSQKHALELSEHLLGHVEEVLAER